MQSIFARTHPSKVHPREGKKEYALWSKNILLRHCGVLVSFTTLRGPKKLHLKLSVHSVCPGQGPVCSRCLLDALVWIDRKQVKVPCCPLGSKAILTWPYRPQTAQGRGGQAQRECRFTWDVQGMGPGDSGPAAIWNVEKGDGMSWPD